MTNIDSVFVRKSQLEKYIGGAANQLPDMSLIWKNTSLPLAFSSDEAFASFSEANKDDWKAVYFAMGQMVDKYSNNFFRWKDLYVSIRMANIVIERIGECQDISEIDRRDFLGRAYFIRAYSYYCLMQEYGPVPILPDKAFPTNASVEEMSYPRGTYDECVNKVCGDFELAAEMLKTERDASTYRIPTSGAALALLSRMRLEAASPWFNGNKYYSGFQRSSDGQPYFSPTYDASKWGAAAAAAKRVIDLGLYELYTVRSTVETPALPQNTGDPNLATRNYPDGGLGIDAYKSYSHMFTGDETGYNISEFIWSRSGTADNSKLVFPYIMSGKNSISVNADFADAYRMIDGRDINNSSEEFKYPTEGWRPISEGSKTGLNKSLLGDKFSGVELNKNMAQADYNREMRYYATIGYNYRLWPASSYTGSSTTDKKNVVVTYYADGTGKPFTYNPETTNYTGYTCVKYVSSMDSPDGKGYVLAKEFPIIRYAEVILNYVEAMNEMESPYTDEKNGITVSRDIEEMRKYFNMIRYRAGQPGITDEELNDKEKMREAIKHERQIEFAFEGRRPYDLRRWGDLVKVTRKGFTGMNVKALVKNRKDYYQKRVITGADCPYSQFDITQKMNLYPIRQGIIDKNTKIDQNPGY